MRKIIALSLISIFAVTSAFASSGSVAPIKPIPDVPSPTKPAPEKPVPTKPTPGLVIL